MPKISPFLWFDTQAEEAANFYTSIFKNSKILEVVRYGEAGPEGRVMTVAFTLDGQEFTALNGGPLFKFTEAISFVVNCETQEEVDALKAAETVAHSEANELLLRRLGTLFAGMIDLFEATLSGGAE